MPQLTNQESRGFTHAFKITAADLNTTGYLTSSQKIIGYIPAGGIVTNCAVVVNTAAAGATDITFSAGTTSGSPFEFIANAGAAIDLDALTKANFNTGTVLINTAAGYSINNTASAVPIYVKFGGTIANLTAGEWYVTYTLLDPALIASNA
jgi:hypothetical protein